MQLHLRYPESMRTMFHTKVYLSAAVLALFFDAGGSAQADRLGVGDFDGPYNVQGPAPLTNTYPVPTLQGPTESSVKPIVFSDPSEFPIEKPEPTPVPATTGGCDTVGGTPNSTNSEESAQMELLWDAWHKRVAQAIYERFNTSAQKLFKHSPPLACQISYMVAKDGRVGNVRVLQPSANPIFNTMLLTVIHSMAGNPVLAFPPDSRRQFVEKIATFTWNHKLGGCDFPPERPPHIGPPAVSK
jgi:hypothetical protein